MRQLPSSRFLVLTCLLSSCVLMGIPTAAVLAEGPSLLKGELPKDSRLEPLQDLNGYFPMEVPASRSAWARRAENVRRRVLVSQGIWPMPTRTPLAAVVHGRQEHGGYSIEKVSFEAMPGFFVTGSL